MKPKKDYTLHCKFKSKNRNLLKYLLGKVANCLSGKLDFKASENELNQRGVPVNFQRISQ